MRYFVGWPPPDCRIYSETDKDETWPFVPSQINSEKMFTNYWLAWGFKRTEEAAYATMIEKILTIK